MQTDADGDEERERAARREPLPVLHLDGRDGAGPHHGGRPAPRDQLLPVDEAEQSCAESRYEQGGERDHAAPRAVLSGRGSQRRLHGLDGGGDHVPEQEKEDAGGDRAQERFEPDGRRAQPAGRQAEEDGEPGESAEQQDLDWWT